MSKELTLVEQLEEKYMKAISDICIGEQEVRLSIQSFRSWFNGLTPAQREEIRASRYEIEDFVTRSKGIVETFAQEIPHMLVS